MKSLLAPRELKPSRVYQLYEILPAAQQPALGNRYETWVPTCRIRACVTARRTFAYRDSQHRESEVVAWSNRRRKLLRKIAAPRRASRLWLPYVQTVSAMPALFAVPRTRSSSPCVAQLRIASIPRSSRCPAEPVEHPIVACPIPANTDSPPSLRLAAEAQMHELGAADGRHMALMVRAIEIDAQPLYWRPPKFARAVEATSTAARALCGRLPAQRSRHRPMVVEPPYPHNATPTVSGRLTNDKRLTYVEIRVYRD